VYLSMRIPQHSNAGHTGNSPINREHFACAKFEGQAFDTNASTTMSVCDGRERKMDWTESPIAFAARGVSPLHRRFANFRQRNVDANDGAKLGYEGAAQQGNPAWPGHFCRWLAVPCARSDSRFAR